MIYTTLKKNNKCELDEIGQFFLKSSQINQYIFIMHHYDTNTIHLMLIKSRDEKHIPQVWEKTFKILKHYGEVLNIHILDNECTYKLKAVF